MLTDSSRSALACGLVLTLAGCERVAPSSQKDGGPSAPVASAASAAPLVATADPPPLGAPYVPPQCYTKTKDADGRVHNPCFTCHVDSAPPNYVNDSSFQLAYEFGPKTRVNPWTNLFVDRSAAVAAISDEEITSYVRRDNYHGSADKPGIAARLSTTKEWDREVMVAGRAGCRTLLSTSTMPVSTERPAADIPAGAPIPISLFRAASGRRMALSATR